MAWTKTKTAAVTAVAVLLGAVATTVVLNQVAPGPSAVRRQVLQDGSVLMLERVVVGSRAEFALARVSCAKAPKFERERVLARSRGLQDKKSRAARPPTMGGGTGTGRQVRERDGVCTGARHRPDDPSYTTRYLESRRDRPP